jgi:hypothetical protein
MRTYCTALHSYVTKQLRNQQIAYLAQEPYRPVSCIDVIQRACCRVPSHKISEVDLRGSIIICINGTLSRQNHNACYSASQQRSRPGTHDAHKPHPKALGVPQFKLDASVPSTQAQPLFRYKAENDWKAPTQYSFALKVAEKASKPELGTEPLIVIKCEPDAHGSVLPDTQFIVVELTFKQECCPSLPLSA